MHSLNEEILRSSTLSMINKSQSFNGMPSQQQMEESHGHARYQDAVDSCGDRPATKSIRPWSAIMPEDFRVCNNQDLHGSSNKSLCKFEITAF